MGVRSGVPEHFIGNSHGYLLRFKSAIIGYTTAKGRGKKLNDFHVREDDRSGRDLLSKRRSLPLNRRLMLSE